MLKGAVLVWVATLLLQANAGGLSGYRIPHLAGRHGTSKNLAEKLTDLNFSTLVDLVVKAGLADTVSNGGPFTVFAPTNKAFAALDPALVNSLVANPEELQKVLLYHVVSGNVPSTALSDNLSVNSAQGAALRFNLPGNAVKVNDVSVTQADIAASNGVIHVIDQVLLPPAAEPTGNLAEVLTAQGFTTLVDLVVKAGLADTVSNSGPFTVFAPTNEAFAALDPALVNSLVANPEELKKVLLYHVVPGNVPSSALSDNLSVDSAQGPALRFNLPGNAVKVNDVSVTQADIAASNGVIHVIDQVLLPPAEPTTGNLAEVLTAQGFTTLVDLVVKAGLADTVSNGGPFTVFAPTNEAFAALDPALVNSLVANPAELRKVLLYHVVAGNVPSSALSDDLSVDSAQGAALRINLPGNGVYVNGVDVTEADIVASNGVIHEVDQVLIPASGNVVETLAADDRFSTLVTAVQTANLVDTLATGGPFTVFAPTDEAFAKLPSGTVNSLLRNPEALKAILLRHVFPAEVYSSTISSPNTYTSAGSDRVNVFRDRLNRVMVQSTKGMARVVIPDLTASNGVIHAINTVI